MRSGSWLGSLHWPITHKGTLWSVMMPRIFVIVNRFICCLKKFTGNLQLIISRLSLVLSKPCFFFLTVRRIRSFCSFSRIVHLIHHWFQIKRIQRLFGFLLWILVTQRPFSLRITLLLFGPLTGSLSSIHFLLRRDTPATHFWCLHLNLYPWLYLFTSCRCFSRGLCSSWRLSLRQNWWCFVYQIGIW